MISPTMARPKASFEHSIAVLVAMATALGITACQSPTPIDSATVAQLEKELQAGKYKYTLEKIQEAPAYAKIEDIATFQELRDLTLQDEFPLVAFAAFLVIQDRYPEETVATAVARILEANGPLQIVYGPCYMVLMDVENSDANRRIVVELLGSYTSASTTSLGALFQALPYAFVYDLYQSHESDLALPARAFIVSRILSEREEAGQGFTISPRLWEELATYSDLPGFPRFSYLLLSDVADPNYKRAFMEALSDPALNDFEVRALLAAKGVAIPAADLEKLVLPSPRDEFVKEHLAKRKE